MGGTNVLILGLYELYKEDDDECYFVNFELFNGSEFSPHLADTNELNAVKVLLLAVKRELQT